MFGIEGMPGIGDMLGIGGMEDIFGMFSIGIFMFFIMSAQQSFDWLAVAGATAFVMG